jgi:hypothetical protein
VVEQRTHNSIRRFFEHFFTPPRTSSNFLVSQKTIGGIGRNAIVDLLPAPQRLARELACFERRVTRRVTTNDATCQRFSLGKPIAIHVDSKLLVVHRIVFCAGIRRGNFLLSSLRLQSPLVVHHACAHPLLAFELSNADLPVELATKTASPCASLGLPALSGVTVRRGFMQRGRSDMCPYFLPSDEFLWAKARSGNSLAGRVYQR